MKDRHGAREKKGVTNWSGAITFSRTLNSAPDSKRSAGVSITAFRRGLRSGTCSTTRLSQSHLDAGYGEWAADFAPQTPYLPKIPGNTMHRMMISR